jgi:hypothetical protein
MKRNPKSFSVEIKKPRFQGQRHSLPPRLLFEPVPAATASFPQREEQQGVAQPVATPRILPSIVKPLWSDAEPVEPVRGEQSLQPEAIQGQMDLDLNERAPEDAKDAPGETLVISEAQSHTDTATDTGDAAGSVHEPHAQETESAKSTSRQPQKKASQVLEPALLSEPVSQPQQASKAQIVGPLRMKGRARAGDRRQTKRQTAAAQLPRQERWKRRLPPAAW